MSNSLEFRFDHFPMDVVRYSLQLTDTVRIGASKSTALTEGVKLTKDTLFFLNAESDEEKPKKQEKKPPVQPKSRGSPQKKTVAGKVLRNGGRRATQDEVHQTAAAKLAEHQKELHEKIQAQGLAKFSEKGGKADGSEGKGWKKFQSYKGEGALPSEAERLKVRAISCTSNVYHIHQHLRLWSTGKHKQSFCRYMVSLYRFISTLSRTPVRMTRVNIHTSASTFRHLANWRARRKTL